MGDLTPKYWNLEKFKWIKISSNNNNNNNKNNNNKKNPKHFFLAILYMIYIPVHTKIYKKQKDTKR